MAHGHTVTRLVSGGYSDDRENPVRTVTNVIVTPETERARAALRGEKDQVAALYFETGVGRVKCHDESSVVFFNTWPDASQYVGKRLRVRIAVI